MNRKNTNIKNIVGERGSKGRITSKKDGNSSSNSESQKSLPGKQNNKKSTQKEKKPAHLKETKNPKNPKKTRKKNTKRTKATKSHVQNKRKNSFRKKQDKSLKKPVKQPKQNKKQKKNISSKHEKTNQKSIPSQMVFTQALQPNKTIPPDQLIQPGQPIQPNQPVQPNQTMQVMQPGQPIQPNQPWQPLQPNQNIQLNQQAQPYQSTQQTMPIQPGQSVQPNQPAQTNQPGQPVQPGQSNQPAQPAQPVQLAQTNQPVQPFQPNQPAQTKEIASKQQTNASQDNLSQAAITQTLATNQQKEQQPENQMTPEEKEKTERVKNIQGKMAEVKSQREKAALKRKNIKKAGLIIASIAAVYLLGVVVFSIFTWPRTNVADTDVSFRTDAGLEKQLSKVSTEYELHISGIDFNLTIPGKNIDYNFDVDEIIQKIKSLKNPFAWPIEIFKIHDFQDNFVVAFNEEKVNNIAAPEIEKHNEVSTKSVDAGFNCDPVDKKVTAKPEIIGSTLKVPETLKTIKQHIGSARQVLELGENEHQIPTIYVSNPKFDKALENANKMIQSSFDLVMGSTNITKIDSILLSQWLCVNTNYEAILNSDLLCAWANDLAQRSDTVGGSRTYITPYGKTVTVAGGDVGWTIDQAALINLINASTQEAKTGSVAIPCSSALSAYLGQGQRDWGPRYIDVDLSQQHARMYDETGSLIWEADIVSGKPDGKKDTPTGVWSIKRKQSPSTLIGANDPETGKPEYESKVDYWMPFVGNSVGFHDATWQSAFGGNLYTTSAGSHGCINLSLALAGALYGICNVGDVVVTHQ